MAFKLFGIKFEISYIFALSLTLFIAFDRSGNFLPLVVAITIHEFSHLITMCFFCAKPTEISLNMGTISIKNSTVLCLNEEIIVLLAGPLSNIIIYLIFSKFYSTVNFANINFILFITNMLCVDGLDGGTILKAILSNFISPKRVNKIMIIIKVLNVIILFGLFIFCFNLNVVNYTFIFFIIYIIFKR